MIYNKKPENFEKIQPMCEIIGFVGDKTIGTTDSGDIRYVEGLTAENVDIGCVIEESASKPITFLSSQEQAEILANLDAMLEDVRLTRLRAYDVVARCHKQDKTLLWGQFLDDFYHAASKYSLIKDEPPYDETEKLLLCNIAASVHKLANDYKLPIPEWVFDKKYIYDGVYYAFDTKNPDFQKLLRSTTPDEYKQRNLIVGDTTLKRC